MSDDDRFPDTTPYTRFIFKSKCIPDGFVGSLLVSEDEYAVLHKLGFYCQSPQIGSLVIKSFEVDLVPEEGLTSRFKISIDEYNATARDPGTRWPPDPRWPQRMTLRIEDITEISCMFLSVEGLAKHKHNEMLSYDDGYG
jgi:hypothetical protein